MKQPHQGARQKFRPVIHLQLEGQQVMPAQAVALASNNDSSPLEKSQILEINLEDSAEGSGNIQIGSLEKCDGT